MTTLFNQIKDLSSTKQLPSLNKSFNQTSSSSVNSVSEPLSIPLLKEQSNSQCFSSSEISSCNSSPNCCIHEKQIESLQHDLFGLRNSFEGELNKLRDEYRHELHSFQRRLLKLLKQRCDTTKSHKHDNDEDIASSTASNSPCSDPLSEIASTTDSISPPTQSASCPNLLDLCDNNEQIQQRQLQSQSFFSESKPLHRVHSFHTSQTVSCGNDQHEDNHDVSHLARLAIANNQLHNSKNNSSFWPRNEFIDSECTGDENEWNDFTMGSSTMKSMTIQQKEMPTPIGQPTHSQSLSTFVKPSQSLIQRPQHSASHHALNRLDNDIMNPFQQSRTMHSNGLPLKSALKSMSNPFHSTDDLATSVASAAINSPLPGSQQNSIANNRGSMMNGLVGSQQITSQQGFNHSNGMNGINHFNNGFNGTPPMVHTSINEEQLIALACRILSEHGAVPVGKMGSLLHKAANDHTLPALLKERYGGLKKFLQSQPRYFALASNHPYNPHVTIVGSIHHQQFQQQMAQQADMQQKLQMSINNFTTNEDISSFQMNEMKPSTLSQTFNTSSSFRTNPVSSSFSNRSASTNSLASMIDHAFPSNSSSAGLPVSMSSTSLSTLPATRKTITPMMNNNTTNKMLSSHSSTNHPSSSMQSMQSRMYDQFPNQPSFQFYPSSHSIVEPRSVTFAADFDMDQRKRM